jgi:hypothetical protein
MILIATNSRDVTVDLIVLELQRRGAPYFRLNTEHANQLAWSLPNGDPRSLVIKSDATSIRLSEVVGAYYRRPLPPVPALGLLASVSEYVSAEWGSILRTLWNALEGRWLNSPYAIQRAEDKPRQLSAAAARGLAVPPTLVTNDLATALEFVGGGDTIAKPLRKGLLEDRDGPGRVMFTSRLTAQDLDHESVRQAPVIFQREIAKRSDIRVTVVDDRVFATTILSQGHNETEVDWRRGGRLDLPHRQFELPKAIAAACVEVTRDLGLRYSAIDLVEDRAGDFWFLEANPNGQWGWIEMRTGHPIASAIVDAMLL